MHTTTTKTQSQNYESIMDPYKLIWVVHLYFYCHSILSNQISLEFKREREREQTHGLQPTSKEESL